MITYFNRIIEKLTLLIEKYFIVLIALIILIAAFNVFYNSESYPINSWDEARHGVSAYEMIKNNNYIVNTFSFRTDYWNLKPPLSFWCISLGYGIAGFNPLGLRLFSGLAALMTIAVVAWFSYVNFGRIASIVSAAVLTATTQYILSHSARTGDADSLHVMFFTLSIVSLYMMFRNIKWLYLSGFFFSMTFLTKSWHSLSILLIVAMFLVFNWKKLKLELRNLAFFIITAFTPILLWAVLRFSQDGFDFFTKMVTFDLLSRSSSTLEGHKGNTAYYLLTLQWGYARWMVVLLAGLGLFMVFYRGVFKPIALLIILWICVPFTLYTIASTKITWYILPVFPALAVSIGAVFQGLLRLKGFFVIKIALMIALLLSFYKYESIIIKRISNLKPEESQITLQKMKNHKEYHDYTVFVQYDVPEYPTSWRQSDLLSAELYGRLIPADGGFPAFIKKDKSLLFVSKSAKYLPLINANNFKIVVDGNKYYILENNIR